MSELTAVNLHRHNIKQIKHNYDLNGRGACRRVPYVSIGGSSSMRCVIPPLRLVLRGKCIVRKRMRIVITYSLGLLTEREK